MTRKDLNVVDDAVKSHEENLIAAMSSEKWMTAVWKVENGKVILQGRTTWTFPKGDMMTAIGLLQEDCQKELDSSPATAFGTLLPKACDPNRRVPFGVVSADKEEINGGELLESEKEHVLIENKLSDCVTESMKSASDEKSASVPIKKSLMNKMEPVGEGDSHITNQNQIDKWNSMEDAKNE